MFDRKMLALIVCVLLNQGVLKAADVMSNEPAAPVAPVVSVDENTVPPAPQPVSVVAQPMAAPDLAAMDTQVLTTATSDENGMTTATTVAPLTSENDVKDDEVLVAPVLNNVAPIEPTTTSDIEWEEPLSGLTTQGSYNDEILTLDETQFVSYDTNLVFYQDQPAPDALTKEAGELLKAQFPSNAETKERISKGFRRYLGGKPENQTDGKPDEDKIEATLNRGVSGRFGILIAANKVPNFDKLSKPLQDAITAKKLVAVIEVEVKPNPEDKTQIIWTARIAGMELNGNPYKFKEGIEL